MKNKPGIALLLAAGLAAVVAPVSAHHSFAAEFDGKKVVRLVGALTKVDWSNPHTYFYLDVKDDKGKVVNWACEGGGPGACGRRGQDQGSPRRLERDHQARQGPRRDLFVLFATCTAHLARGGGERRVALPFLLAQQDIF